MSFAQDKRSRSPAIALRTGGAGVRSLLPAVGSNRYWDYPLCITASVNETLGRIQMLISPSPIGSDPVAMDAKVGIL